MKKLFYSFVLLATFLSAVFPAKAAPLFDPPAEDADWSCVLLYNGTCPPGNMSPYFVEGSFTASPNINVTITEALLNCSPGPGCKNDYNVYFRVEFSLVFDVFGSGNTEHVRIWAGAQARTPSSLIYTETDCGTSTGGTCSGIAYGIIPAASMPTTSSTYDVRAKLESHTNGSWPVSYTVSAFNVAFSLLPIEQCESSYTEVGDFVTHEIDPTIEDPLGPEGSPPDFQIFPMETGNFYKVSRGGSGWNDGASDHQDLTISWDGETWIPLIPGNADCSGQGEGGDVDTYYITAMSDTFYIRVNDDETEFEDNTQVDEEDPVTYTVGQVVTSVPCEDQFSYNPTDDLLASVVVEGDDEDGVQASNTIGLNALPPLVAGEWYAIKVTSGTWRDEGIAPDRTDMEYQVTPGYSAVLASYADLGSSGDGVWCQSTDETTWYIQARSISLFLRANNVSSGWAANTGELNVSIYHATFTRPLEACEYSYDLYGAPHRDEVSGNASNGKSFAYVEAAEPVAPEIPILGADTWSARPLEAGAWYVLDTIEGPWTPDSTNPKVYQFDMSVNDGDGWIPLKDWDTPVCNVALDALGHRRVYFQVPAGPLEWFLRVNDTGSFGNNGGYMAWNLYRAIEVDINDPTANTWIDCLAGYDPSVYELTGSSNFIPVKMDSGTYVKENNYGTATETSGSVLSAGTEYIIEISGGPWDDDDTDEIGGTRFDAAISKDNGVTWSPIDGSTPGMDCISITQDDRYAQIRFTVLPGEIWKIRVNDNDSDFSNNGGNLSYMLISFNLVSGGPTGTSMSPACDLPAMRPVVPADLEDLGSWLNYVAQWIDYVGVAIRQFFIFCPKQIQAILDLYDKIKAKEPLASVIEAGQMINDVRIEIESYDWDVDGVDTSIFSISSAAQLENIITSHVFITDNEEALSPWEGGDIIDVNDFKTGTWSASSYYNTCMSSFSGYLPPLIAQGVCFASASFRDTGASFWIQISIDISCIFMYVKLTKRPVQELIYMLTGVRPWTKGGAEDAIEKLTEHAIARDRAIATGADPTLVSRYWSQRKR